MKSNKLNALAALLLLPTIGHAVPYASVSYGLTWFQYDYNSNHDDTAYGAEIGYDMDHVRLAVSYLRSDNDYTVMLPAGSDWAANQIETDSRFFTAWLLPRFDWGRFSLAAGPGLGVVYDDVSVNSRTRSGFERDVALRADFVWRITPRVSAAFSYRSHYFEVDTPGVYEVDQDRVFYLGSLGWAF